MTVELPEEDQIATAPRAVGDRATEAMGNFSGVITEVHGIEGYPDLFEYSIRWDDGNYADERWGEGDLWPLPIDSTDS